MRSCIHTYTHTHTYPTHTHTHTHTHIQANAGAQDATDPDDALLLEAHSEQYRPSQGDHRLIDEKLGELGRVRETQAQERREKLRYVRMYVCMYVHALIDEKLGELGRVRETQAQERREKLRYVRMYVCMYMYLLMRS